MTDSKPLAGTYDWSAPEASPWRLARAQFLARVAQAIASGQHPTFVTGTTRSDARADDLVADSWKVLGRWGFYTDSALIVDAAGAQVLIATDPDSGTVDVWAWSVDPDKANGAVSTVLAAAPTPPILSDDGRVETRFWYSTSMGPASNVRSLEAPTWESCAGNYPSALRDRLAAMSAWQIPPSGGKLLLAHGPAGTGKTSAIRALTREWAPWCETHYIVDPDEFFGHAAYMTGVLIGDWDCERWRLVVVEDADELLAADAKKSSGQAMARLLNVCDGMVGQGLRVLVMVTTNEPIADMHPAIVRPGRCLADLYFDRLGPEDADAWRADRGLASTGEEASLAELYDEDRTSRRTAAAVVGRTLAAHQHQPS